MVNTKNLGGTELQKRFTVFTNDPDKSKVRLQVSGKVKGFVTVEPRYIRLTGPIGLPISRTIRLAPIEGYPFTITGVHAEKNEFVRFRVQPLDTDSGKAGYRLLVENTKKEAGTYHDTIIIKMDSKHKPVLRIPVFGRIYPPQQSKNGNPSK